MYDGRANSQGSWGWNMYKGISTRSTVCFPRFQMAWRLVHFILLTRWNLQLFFSSLTQCFESQLDLEALGPTALTSAPSNVTFSPSNPMPPPLLRVQMCNSCILLKNLIPCVIVTIILLSYKIQYLPLHNPCTYVKIHKYTCSEIICIPFNLLVVQTRFSFCVVLQDKIPKTFLCCSSVHICWQIHNFFSAKKIILSGNGLEKCLS